MNKREIAKIERMRLWFCRLYTLDNTEAEGLTLDNLQTPPGDPKYCIVTDEGKCEFDGRKCDAVKFRLVREEDAE